MPRHSGRIPSRGHLTTSLPKPIGRFAIELEQEDEGRWVAEVPDLPGVLAYGPTERAAIAATEALALRVLADRLDQGEVDAPVSIRFTPPLT